jgi:hypothetical protein
MTKPLMSVLMMLVLILQLADCKDIYCGLIVRQEGTGYCQ